MEKMTRAEVLRKCLIVFDALKRVYSKGNAGLEALPGAEESYRNDSEICRVLREWLQEMETGAQEIRMRRLTKEEYEGMKGKFIGRGQILVPCGPKPETDMPLATDTLEYMRQGNPLMAPETIAAARRMDEARDKIIDQIGRPEPDVPKVVDLKEWQRLKTPPERMDFDEDP